MKPEAGVKFLQWLALMPHCKEVTAFPGSLQASSHFQKHAEIFS